MPRSSRNTPRLPRRSSSGSPTSAPSPAADSAEPLGDGEIEGLLAPVADTRTIALAVSGGADSLALMLAVERWRIERRRPAVVVLTVDHGLQAESATVAETVMRAAREAGFPALRLTWSGPAPASDIEAAAREARYRLLLGAAREAGASHLLLAHHRDDQAETLLMRLQRGSGVFGLAAMRREVAAGEVTLFRPFLDIPRVRLSATVARAGLVPHEDPMNTDPRFFRARIRRLMPLLVTDGFDPAGLAMTAERLGKAAEAIDNVAGRLIARSVTADDFAIARLDRNGFLTEPDAIRHRVLVRLLAAVGGEPYPARAERIEALHGAIAAHASGRLKRTLSGVVIEWKEGAILFYREIGREGLPATPIAPGGSAVFDHRFRLAVSRTAPRGLTVAALGEDGRASSGLRREGVPAAALAALPAIHDRAGLLACPGLAWWRPSGPRFDVVATCLLAGRLAHPSAFPQL